jgi:hypothetical protein
MMMKIAIMHDVNPSENVRGGVGDPISTFLQKLAQVQ